MFSYLITVVTPQVCLIDGVTYTAGLEFVAADGCNECECIAGVITCTTEPCAGKCTRLLIAELECSWCEMFLVRDVLGARCSWCEMFLVREVLGARSSWCEKFLVNVRVLLVLMFGWEVAAWRLFITILSVHVFSSEVTTR